MKILIIQTAFIGDVILSTSLLESIYEQYPKSEISILIRRGTESLFDAHPFLSNIFIWDKKSNKWGSMIQIIGQLRDKNFDVVINLQRFFSSGLFTLLSGANQKLGYKKNPLSMFFSKSFPHIIGKKGDLTYLHEIERNFQFGNEIGVMELKNPKLYPNESNQISVNQYIDSNYITISPASVWFTKQYPLEKWIEFLSLISGDRKVYLLGGKSDFEICEELKNQSSENVVNLAGKLSFLESALLYKNSKMNYVNDSAPMHLCSSMDAPTCAIFCSTIKEFGFGPLSSNSNIVNRIENLICQPCGLHGHKLCPEVHFKCALEIHTIQLLSILN